MPKPGVKIYGSIILIMISLTGLAQKTDKVFLKNGDIITGEIKSMKFAKLSFDMDGPGIIQVKWEFIVKIISDKIFQVTMRKREVFVTKLDRFCFKRQEATMNDIVEIVQIKDRFLKRLDGDINLGFNYAKSNSILQFNFSSAITYRKPKLETNLKLNSVISGNSSDSTRSKKQDATVNVMRRFNKSFYIDGVLAWQENTELGLDNRFLLSLAGGKIIFNNNRRRFLTGAGLSYNLEQSNRSTGYDNNLEAQLGLQFKEFHYTTPKISIDTKFILYSGITDWGRLRMDFQLNSKIEIFKDFNVGLSFYNVYDNRPLSATASHNDYGINFTLGYEFGK